MAFKKEEIIALLKDENPQDADRYAAYCLRLLTEPKSRTDKSAKNPWMAHKTAEVLAELFRRVKREGLVFDGVHVTLGNRGISYDYIAYKNKMFKVYPDSKMDVGLVHGEDQFTSSKRNGKVEYTHVVADPFNQTWENLKGGYCVIKNPRGEFITLLSKEDIEKHRKVAMTDSIWRQWPIEMTQKTLVKKACKLHFADMFQGIEEDDNANYDLDNPIDLELEWKKEIDSIEGIGELMEYAKSNAGRGKSFDQYIAKRAQTLSENPETQSE